jgi:hypothetical protein
MLVNTVTYQTVRKTNHQVSLNVLDDKTDTILGLPIGNSAEMRMEGSMDCCTKFSLHEAPVTNCCD